MSKAKDDFPMALKPFRFHGVEFITESGNDSIADCPFCHKSRALSVNRDTGQWTCHSRKSRCGRSGNIITFLEQLVEHCSENTDRAHLNSLCDARKNVPRSVFTPWNICWHEAKERWLIPITSKNGTVHDVRAWRPGGKMMGTAGRPTGLWNMKGLNKASAAHTVWICEGEWDGMILTWLFKKCKQKRNVVVAVPGARVFKDEWVEELKNRDVVVCGDNDEDGHNMQRKIFDKYNGRIRYLNWPESLPNGFDIGDFVASLLNEGVTPQQMLNQIEDLVEDKPHRPFEGAEDRQAARTGKREKIKRPKTNPSFNKVMKVFEEELLMTDDMRMAVTASFAVYLSTQWAGEPLWLFLVGPPSCGKTECLLSMEHAPETLYYSSIHPEALISGFKSKNKDPSTIPKMVGRCSVFKDWTQVLEAPEVERRKTYNMFRGFFDGRVKQPFGNLMEREYFGTGSMLAGVTNKVHGYSDASVGERFLKFQFSKPNRSVMDQLMDTVMMGVTHEKEKSERLQDITSRFLNRDVPKLSPIRVVGSGYRERIKGLALLISKLRTTCEWTGFGYTKEIMFRPEEEYPLRLAKQFVKLAMALCVMFKKDKVDDEVYSIVERIAMNTANGFNLDIMTAMMSMNDGRNISMKDIELEANIPDVTLRRSMEGLIMMRFVKVSSMSRKDRLRMGAGRPGKVHTVVPSIRKLWEQAAVQGDYTDSFEAGRRKQKGWD